MRQVLKCHLWQGCAVIPGLPHLQLGDCSRHLIPARLVEVLLLLFFFEMSCFITPSGILPLMAMGYIWCYRVRCYGSIVSAGENQVMQRYNYGVSEGDGAWTSSKVS